MRATILLAVTLGGCTMAPFGGAVQTYVDRAIDTAIEDRKHYNDKKGKVLTTLPCDISVGAFSRMPEGNVKQGVALLCGIDTGIDPSIITFITAAAMMNAANDGRPLSEVVEAMRELSRTKPPPEQDKQDEQVGPPADLLP